jgi:hypothetical protein
MKKSVKAAIIAATLTGTVASLDAIVTKWKILRST